MTVPFDPPTLINLFTTWRDQSRAGLTQPGAAERLADLADPRVPLFNVVTGQTLSGAAAVSVALSGVWGVTVAPEAAQQYLLTMGRPP